MSRILGFKVTASILLFSFFVLFAPMWFWYLNVENQWGPEVTGYGPNGPTVEHKHDPVTLIFPVGLPLLAFVGGARGLFKSVKKEGAVAPLQITFAAVCASFALLGVHVLLISEPESVMARASERHDFNYIVFTVVFTIAAIALLASAIKEQRRTKSTAAANPPT